MNVQIQLSSNNFHANLFELSKEKIIQIEGKNKNKILFYYQSHNFVGYKLVKINKILGQNQIMTKNFFFNRILDHE